MAFIFYNKYALDVAKKVERNPHMTVASLNLDNIFACLSEPDINIKAVDSYGNTLLHSTLKNKFNDISTQRQIIKVLEILLDKGVDVNAKNGYLETVLHLAIDKRMKDVVQMLIKRGADLDVRDVRGNKLAHFFINKILQRKLISEEGSADFLNFLVQQGVDINCKNSEGESVMSIAVKANLVPIITTCLSANADLRNPDDEITMLFDKILNDCLFCKNKKQKSKLEECLAMLMTKGADVNKRNIEGLSPLQLAFQRKNVQLMLLLEWHGADLSVLENNIYLHRLCSRRTNGTLNTRNAYKDVTQLLIRAGCDVNAVDNEGQTPLYRATEAGNVKMVRVLIELGVDVKGSQECQIAPLHRVVMDENVDLLKILIAAGADVNAKSASGSTPLHLASHRRNIVVAELLLNAGARVDVVDNDVKKPLDVAIKHQKSRVVLLLLSRGVRVEDYATFREIEKLIGPSNSIRENCIKLMAVGMLGKQDSRFYSRNQFHRQFYVDCLREVNRMNAWMVSGRVSFYDFLHMDWNLRCGRNFVGNEKILELLGVKERRKVAELINNGLITNVNEIPVDKSKLKAEFPLYHELMYTIYVETFSRRPLLEPAKCAWYTLTDINLPDVCVLKILAHLPNDTLRAMIEGAQSGNFKRPLITESVEAAKKRRVSRM